MIHITHVPMDDQTAAKKNKLCFSQIFIKKKLTNEKNPG